jgi:hypothetical protein
MQKVEGSSPFSRSQKSPPNRRVFCWPAESSWGESEIGHQNWASNACSTRMPQTVPFRLGYVVTNAPHRTAPKLRLHAQARRGAGRFHLAPNLATGTCICELQGRDEAWVASRFAGSAVPSIDVPDAATIFPNLQSPRLARRSPRLLVTVRGEPGAVDRAGLSADSSGRCRTPLWPEDGRGHGAKAPGEVSGAAARSGRSRRSHRPLFRSCCGVRS